jgi:hypothetical protein
MPSVKCRAGSFRTSPPGISDDATLSEEEERSWIEEAAKITDGRQRVSRLLWHLWRHGGDNKPLWPLVVTKFVSNKENEEIVAHDLHILFRLCVERTNYNYWAFDRQWEKPRVPPVPIEISGGLSGQQLRDYLRQQAQGVDTRAEALGYDSITHFAGGLLHCAGRLNYDTESTRVAIRLIAPLLFYESHSVWMDDTGTRSVADYAADSLSALRPPKLPTHADAEATRAPGYNRTRLMQEWWIRHAPEYGAERPTQEVIEASRRLHDPPFQRDPNAVNAASSEPEKEKAFGALTSWTPIWFCLIALGLFVLGCRLQARSRRAP